MSVKLHIGNLGQATTENDLSNLFNHVGLVMYTSIPKDERTGAFKNFGIVSMGSPEAAQAAINTYNGYMLRNNPISVSMAVGKEAE